MVDVIYDAQSGNVSWYKDPIPNGSAPDNFVRILELRKLFCHPLTIQKDGTLNKKYFRAVSHETARNWNDIELLQLYEGIYKHGVDAVEKWIQIQADFLPQRDFIEVRLKLCQLFGCQNLSKYKGSTFKSEKEIEDEYNKNKAEGTKSGNWNEKCNVILKQNVGNLTREQVKELAQKELDNWNENVLENPTYIYRVANNASKGKREKKRSTKSKDNKQKKNTNKKVQKNTIDQMLKKQKTEKKDVAMEEKNKNTNKKKPEQNSNVAEVDVSKKIKTKTKTNTKRKKKVTKKKNLEALLPEDSDDEEMLCVE